MMCVRVRQNMAGFATLRVKGLAAGTAITLRYGEVLQVSNYSYQLGFALAPLDWVRQFSRRLSGVSIEVCLKTFVDPIQKMQIELLK